MKQDVEWHENCLASQKSSLNKQREEIARLEVQKEERVRQYNFYLYQITLAKKEKKTGFDRDLYALKRSGG